MNNKNVRKIIHYGLFLIIIIYIITGLGIARIRIIGPLTFELLSKPGATKIHSYLLYPLIVFFYLHIIITLKKSRKSSRKNEYNDNTTPTKNKK